MSTYTRTILIFRLMALSFFVSFKTASDINLPSLCKLNKILKRFLVLEVLSFIDMADENGYCMHPVKIVLFDGVIPILHDIQLFEVVCLQ